MAGTETSSKKVKKYSLLNAEKKKVSKSLQCPNCAAGLTLRGVGVSIAIKCESCGSIIDPRDENLSIISTAKSAKKFESGLEIGGKGRLFGTSWVVMGFIRREDVDEGFGWDEYLLYSRQKGFRWLVDFQGHWSFVSPTKYLPRVIPSGDEPKVTYESKTYDKFHSGRARVVYVEGEFYWRIAVGDKAEFVDYKRGNDQQVTAETTDDECVWSESNNIAFSQIETSFKVSADARLRALNPVDDEDAPRSRAHMNKVLMIAFGYAFISFIIFAASALFSQNKLVYVKQVTAKVPIQGEVNNPNVITENIEFTGSNSNVVVDVVSDVNNGWTDFDVTLTNEETGVAYSIAGSNEFYSGYEGGESWSEGSRSFDHTFYDVPAGKYVLDVDAESTTSVPVSIKLRRDVPDVFNLIMSLGLLFGFAFMGEIAFYRKELFNFWVEHA
ncbi:MAG: DUF4178 domain-containing protein [Proteobacteria bacterium]|nr:DUF4178 domain-containing protein [Pseudomonadota bacterium]